MHQRTTSRNRPGRTGIAACSALAAATAVAIQACTYQVPVKTRLPGGQILLQVTPAGNFAPSDGREMDSPPWNIDAVSAQAVIQRFAAATANQPLVLDYEHQTLNKATNGQPAPAAGWFRELRWIDGKGLYAVAELTQRAQDYIANGEYLYFSPVFEYSKATGQVLQLHMGALTNAPAIHGMEPLSLLAAATAAFIVTPQQEPSVNPLLKALLASLGLPETTTEANAITALTALGPLTALQGRAVAACSALALPADASPDAVTAACTSLRTAAPGTPDPAKYVPIGMVTELQTNLAALTARQQQSDVDTAVGAALNDGRLLPGMEAWARDLGKTNMAALTSYLGAAQPIAALASTQTGGLPPGGLAKGDAQLSAPELAVCSAMGLTPEQYKAGATAVAAAA
ncbi:phage protease [Acidovorax sp. LjRoot118]|uniref:phage protease n=1 Tax=Acidovorax sp. LjRoot118 TaxID=3342256 RepID=UPI003ED1100F